MGGADKGLIDLHGRPMVAHVAARLSEQVDALIIVANRNTEEYARYADTVVSDRLPDFAGPLAGVQAGLAATAPGHALFVPCDAPALPLDLARRLLEPGAPAAVAHDGRRLQPTFSLLATGIAPELETAIEEGTRALHAWLERAGAVTVDFADQREAFSNINTAAELARFLGDPPPQTR